MPTSSIPLHAPERRHVSDSTRPFGNPGPAGSRAGARSRWGRWPDFLVIGSIVLLVVMTSLPRLRAFVVRSNEMDARETLQRLVAHDLGSQDFDDLLASSAAMRRRFQDGEVSEDGSQLRFHGFRFVIERGDRDWKLLAWPERVGKSGLHAYCASGDGDLWAHPNAAGRWSGSARIPVGLQPGPDGGWQPLRRTLDVAQL